MVAAHKEFPVPNNDLYMPILVGAVNNYKPGMTFQRDDEGDNISAKNPSYCELTGIYWAWKNLKDVDAVGLVHYRRYLYTSKPYDLKNIATEQEITNLLKKYDVILPKERNYYIENTYKHYNNSHHIEPLDKTREIIARNYPEYLSAFDGVMKSTKAHMFNMFVMKKPMFDSYCEFLFGVLSTLEEQIDISDYSVQEKRVFGYISELLMDTWLYTNQFSYTELAWGQLGGKKTVKKAFNLLKRKVGIGSKQTHF